jgi:Tfp pilus assembly protein PilF
MGEMTAAEPLLDTALAIAPHDPRANRTLALLYLTSGRAALAERPLQVLAAAGGDEARFALADYYITMRRTAEARTVLRSLHGDSRTMSGAETRLARLEYLEGNRQGAHARLDAVLSRDPGNGPVLLAKAWWLLADGKHADAVTMAEAALKTDPSSMDAHFLLGTLYAATKATKRAIAAFSEVLRLNPRVVAAQLQLSRLHLADGSPDHAVQLAEGLVRSVPANPAAHIALARGYLGQGRASQAKSIAASLLKQHRDSAEVHALDGTARALDGDQAGARAAFAQALARDPASFEALAGLTALDVLQRNLMGARRRLDARLRATPDHPGLLMLLARVSILLDDMPTAERSLKRVLAIDPSDSAVYAALAQVYIATGRVDAAASEFDAIVRRDARNIPARTMRAIIAWEHQDVAGAKAQYREILAMNPNATIAANNLAWILAGEGSLAEALRLAQQAAIGAPASAEIQDTIGWIYHQQEVPSLAIGPLKAAVSLDPQNSTYRYHLAVAHMKNGDRAHARAALEAALKLRPDFPDAQRLVASLR